MRSLLIPPAQQKLENKVSAIQTRYSNASELDKDQIEKDAKKLLKSTDHEANKWVIIVDEVVIGRTDMEITSKHVGFEVTLEIVDKDAFNLARSIQSGDEIVFSGNLGRERSFTTGGMMEEPEFKLKPTYFAKGGWSATQNLQSKEKEVIAEPKTEKVVQAVATNKPEAPVKTAQSMGNFSPIKPSMGVDALTSNFPANVCKDTRTEWDTKTSGTIRCKINKTWGSTEYKFFYSDKNQLGGYSYFNVTIIPNKPNTYSTSEAKRAGKLFYEITLAMGGSKESAEFNKNYASKLSYIDYKTKDLMIPQAGGFELSPFYDPNGYDIPNRYKLTLNRPPSP